MLLGFILSIHPSSGRYYRRQSRSIAQEWHPHHQTPQSRHHAHQTNPGSWILSISHIVSFSMRKKPACFRKPVFCAILLKSACRFLRFFVIESAYTSYVPIFIISHTNRFCVFRFLRFHRNPAIHHTSKLDRDNSQCPHHCLVG